MHCACTVLEKTTRGPVGTEMISGGCGCSCAGLEKDNCPPDFHAVEMEKVLRNPPSVQRILQDTDYGQNR